MEQEIKYVPKSEILKKLKTDSTTFYRALDKLGIECVHVHVNDRMRLAITEKEFERVKGILSPSVVLRNFYGW